MSKHAIDVIDCHTEGMERGFLFVKIQDIVFVVMHLNAHSAAQREQEAKLVISTLKARGLDTHNTSVIMMGDFNTLSPLDATCYGDEELIGYLFDANVSG